MDLQFLYVLRFHDANLIHFIGQNFLQHVQPKHVSFDQLIQIGKQLRRRQTSMAGKHAVGAHAAHRQRGTRNVPHGDLQHRFVRAMINGQHAVQRRNFNIAHDPCAGDVQQALVSGHFIIAEHEAVFFPHQQVIVRARLLYELLRGAVVHLRHAFSIGLNGHGLMSFIPIVTEAGIQQQGEPCEEDKDQQDCRKMLFHAVFSLMLDRRKGGAPGRENPSPGTPPFVQAYFSAPARFFATRITIAPITSAAPIT